MIVKIMKKIPLFLILAASVVILGTGCGDYKPCEVLAKRICTYCPRVADHWQAACLCIENGSLKEKGYKCKEVTEEDQIRCNATLEYWDDDTCEQLN